MLKRFLPYSLAVLLISAVVLAGCGGGNAPTPTDNDLINDLLDRYQTGVVNENIDLVASLCAYPFYFLDGTTFNTAAELINSWQNMLATMVDDYEVCEFSSRIITITGKSATVDAYLHQVTKLKSGESQDNTLSVKITLIKIDESWKISRIEQCTDIEKYMIDDLLDQYQAAMKNMDADTLVSLCAFPYDDDGTSYADAAAMKAAYQTKFAQTESISVYEIINRVIDENAGLAQASIHVKKKPSGGDWLEYTDEYHIGVQKVGGAWKVAGIMKI